MEIINSVERRLEHNSRNWSDWYYFYKVAQNEDKN